MAKFLENDNESPEVDLKNLTVKLAGMGLDEEIEDVIPGKKEKKKKASDKSEAEQDDKNGPEEENENIPEDSSEDPEDVSESEEVSEYYEKRAAERDLTLEKVEELAEEMEASDEKKQKVSALDTIIAKSEKKPSEAKAKDTKKKGKLDPLAICGIVLAIAALLGGAFWLYASSKKEPTLGITLKTFNSQYRNTPIYRNTIFRMGFNIPEETYRDVTKASVSAASSDPSAVTTAVNEDYEYFDMIMSGRVQDGIQEPVYISGRQMKDSKMLKSMRFYSPIRNAGDLEVYYVLYSAFLQSFYTKTDSTKCLEMLKNAYNLSTASTDSAVMVKEGDYAYAVTKADIDGQPCFVMDIVPAKEAGKYVFYNKMYAEPSLRITERSFRALYYSCPIYSSVLLEMGASFSNPTYLESADPATARYKYFTNVVAGAFIQGEYQIALTVAISGCEKTDDNFMKWMRLCTPIESVDDPLIAAYNMFFAASLQSVYAGTDSQTALNKIKTAYAQFSEKGSVAMVKDGYFAYAVTVAEVDGQLSLVLDIIPVEDADTFDFNNPVKD
ncbi:MAG: hypothetical protein IKR22_08080 [Clostridiales bacterium]|nr:hypothetical protein [Clostridiales bacterium]